jgi:hypothetical protein
MTRRTSLEPDVVITDIRLPQSAGFTAGTIAGGVGKVSVEIPAGVGADIHVTVGIDGRDVDRTRFQSLGGGDYRSLGYDTAANRVELHASELWRVAVTPARGVRAGVALDLLTFLLARFGPPGGGDGRPWSLRTFRVAHAAGVRFDRRCQPAGLVGVEKQDQPSDQPLVRRRSTRGTSILAIVGSYTSWSSSRGNEA